MDRLQNTLSQIRQRLLHQKYQIFRHDLPRSQPQPLVYTPSSLLPRLTIKHQTTPRNPTLLIARAIVCCRVIDAAIIRQAHAVLQHRVEEEDDVLWELVGEIGGLEGRDGVHEAEDVAGGVVGADEAEGAGPEAVEGAFEVWLWRAGW